MRNVAIGLLMMLLLSVLVEPLVEISSVLKEKIVLGTALSNACRAAEERSLQYIKGRNLDAEFDEDRFKEYFSDAFEGTMNVTRKSTTGNTIIFEPNDEKYNQFTVTLAFSSKTDSLSDNTVSELRVNAESLYKFKTKYLRVIASSSAEPYYLTSERMLLLKIKN